MNFQQGQRLIFRNCRLLKRTGYVSKFRDEEKTIYRHLFSSDQGLVVYTGNFLRGIGANESRDIKGTVKRIESFGGGTVRISRPILLDVAPAPLYEGEAKSRKG